MGASVELSLNSVVGLTVFRTMKLKSSIGSKEVIILIDWRTSHNFISEEMVQQLGLPLSSTTGYGVIMETNFIVKGEGVCRNIKLQLQNVTVEEDFLPLELGSSDMILGMQWLRKLGNMHIN